MTTMSATLTKTCAAPGCPNPVPEDKRFDAVYCSLKCQRRESQRRHRARVTKRK